jgi:hypothetical protein
MTHPADESLKQIEDNYYAAVAAILNLMEVHGASTIGYAMEDAIRVWNDEHEEDKQ